MKTLILRSASAATLILSLSAAAATSASAQDALSDEIIVTGSPLMRSVDEAITGVSVLTGEELSLRLAGTIGETLKSEPGVSSTFFGARALEEEEEHHDDDDHDEDEHEEEEGHGHEDEEEAFGRLENSQTKTTALTGGASYIGERGFIGFAVSKFDSDYGIPGGHGHGL